MTDHRIYMYHLTFDSIADADAGIDPKFDDELPGAEDLQATYLVQEFETAGEARTAFRGYKTEEELLDDGRYRLTEYKLYVNDNYTAETNRGNTCWVPREYMDPIQMHFTAGKDDRGEDIHLLYGSNGYIAISAYIAAGAETDSYYGYKALKGYVLETLPEEYHFLLEFLASDDDIDDSFGFGLMNIDIQYKVFDDGRIQTSKFHI